MKSRHLRCPALVLALAVLAPSVPAAEEESAPDEIFQERIGVEVVNVDVVVTDKKGRPVEGLGRDDFELRIDGQKVPIANFYAVSASESSGPRSSEEPAVADELAPARVDDPLNLVVYLDNLYLTPQSRERVLRDLPSFFEQQVAAGARIMLIHRVQTVSVLTPFTNDLAELSDALARMAEAPTVGIQHKSARSLVLRSVQDVYQMCANSPKLIPCEDCLDQMIEIVRFYSLGILSERRAAMAALGNVTNALSVLEGKKALLHVSDGMEQQTGVDLFFYVGEQLCPEKRQEFQEYFLRQDVYDLADVVSQANASRVTLYALEAEGLRSFSAAAAEYESPFFRPSPTVDQIRFSNLQGSLFYISSETGGKSILNANQFAGALEKLGSEFQTYYSLGYQPQHVGRGEKHRVAVKVEKKNHQVRYRRSILHKRPEQQLADRALGAVMFGVTDNPLGAEVRPGAPSPAAEGRLSVPLEVAVPVGKLTFVPNEGGIRSGRMTVVVAAPDEKGKKTVIRKKEIVIDLPPESEETEELYRFGVNVELLPGEYNLGVGIWDEVAATGSFLGLRVDARAEDEALAVLESELP